VWSSAGRLYAELSDGGRGFDPGREAPATATGGVGLRGMRARACAIGGNLTIQSEPAMGTKVRFEMALMKEDEEEPEGEAVRVPLVEDHAAI
jgi:signal transduction histidine kinase